MDEEADEEVESAEEGGESVGGGEVSTALEKFSAKYAADSSQCASRSWASTKE